MKLDVQKLAIIHYPDARLRQPAGPVEAFDGDLTALAERMRELMRTADGVGLSAPQVGLPLRLFVMDVAHGQERQFLAFVNPELHGLQGSAEAEEGCLSLPGINANVRRAKRCRIEARDLQGRPITLEGEDLTARVWQHELDHLGGVLIIDRMGPSDKIATRKTLRALEEGYAGARK